jgi:hypothetical protein
VRHGTAYTQHAPALQSTHSRVPTARNLRGCTMRHRPVHSRARAVRLQDHAPLRGILRHCRTVQRRQRASFAQFKLDTEDKVHDSLDGAFGGPPATVRRSLRPRLPNSTRGTSFRPFHGGPHSHAAA